MQSSYRNAVVSGNLAWCVRKQEWAVTWWYESL